MNRDAQIKYILNGRHGETLTKLQDLINSSTPDDALIFVYNLLIDSEIKESDAWQDGALRGFDRNQ